MWHCITCTGFRGSGMLFVSSPIILIPSFISTIWLLSLMYRRPCWRFFLAVWINVDDCKSLQDTGDANLWVDILCRWTLDPKIRCTFSFRSNFPPQTQIFTGFVIIIPSGQKSGWFRNNQIIDDSSFVSRRTQRRCYPHFRYKSQIMQHPLEVYVGCLEFYFEEKRHYDDSSRVMSITLFPKTCE